jgi:hypothetical protein
VRRVGDEALLRTDELLQLRRRVVEHLGEDGDLRQPLRYGGPRPEVTGAEPARRPGQVLQRSGDRPGKPEGEQCADREDHRCEEPQQGPHPADPRLEHRHRVADAHCPVHLTTRRDRRRDDQ